MVQLSDYNAYSAQSSERAQAFLSRYLPNSLPLLRRLQYHLQHESAIVATSFDLEQARAPDVFAVGYCDPASGQAWIFSSLEVGTPVEIISHDNALEPSLQCLRAVFACFKQAWQLVADAEPIAVLCSVRSVVADALRADTEFNAIRDDIRGRGGPYGKYLLSREKLAEGSELSLPEGYHSDTVNASDFNLVIENNDLVGNPQNLVGRPSTGIRQGSSGLLKACKFLTGYSRLERPYEGRTTSVI